MASSLFSYGDVRNHPHRSGFDLSRRICFTSKAGELLPVYYKLVYPGDKFNIRHQLFTRTQPVNTAAYTRIREYLDWYFVPLRLINKNLPQALMNMQNNPVQASGIGTNKIVTNDIPYCALGAYNEGYSENIFTLLHSMYKGNSAISLPVVKNFFGFNAGTCGAKLAMMLRYGNFVPSSFTGSSEGEMSLGLSTDPNFSLQGYNTLYSVNILPFAAYQKIYADHFRISQWEQNEPYTYNFDWYSGGPVFQSLTGSSNFVALKEYLSSNNLFTLRYANWPKDLFMGVMPNSQLGDVSVVDVLPTSESPSNLIGNVVGVSATGDVDITGQIAMNKVAGSSTGEYNLMPTRQPDSAILKTIISNPSLQASFTVLQLRMAEAVQRYREVAQVADQTVRDQIYAHFGVTLSPALSDTCFRIGGSASNIDISEVVNNNLTGENQADIMGKGVGSGQGGVNFSSDEYGILMAIYHITPLLDYVITGQPQDLLYTNTADLPFPEFDSIGMQSLHFGRFFNYKSDAFTFDPTGSVMGYTPRFIDLKTDYDEVYGAFRSTLKSWVAPLDPEYLSKWVSSTINTGRSNTSTCGITIKTIHIRVISGLFKAGTLRSRRIILVFTIPLFQGPLILSITLRSLPLTINSCLLGIPFIIHLSDFLLTFVISLSGTFRHTARNT